MFTANCAAPCGRDAIGPRSAGVNRNPLMANLIETALRKTMTQGVMKLAAFNRQRMAEPEQPNPFLVGLNAPMDKELTLTELAVTGSIPPTLDGRYLRIGPNPINPPQAASHHWFVGDGMVHGLRLQGGRALWYRNRWLRSTAVSKALGEPRAPGPRHFSDTVNTNVMGHAGKTWALVEAGGFPVELGDELQTIAHNPFEGSLKGSFSAHAHRDPGTGELHAVCYEATDQERIRHVVVGVDGLVRRDEPIAVKHGPSVHDCMITRQYVIVLDLPVTCSWSRVTSRSIGAFRPVTKGLGCSGSSIRLRLKLATAITPWVRVLRITFSIRLGMRSPRAVAGWVRLRQKRNSPRRLSVV